MASSFWPLIQPAEKRNLSLGKALLMNEVIDLLGLPIEDLKKKKGPR